MFEGLTQRFNGVFNRIRGRGKITEENVTEAMREVRTALLEADVHVQVVKKFTDEVMAKALGAKVIETLHPDQVLVKIVHDELISLMGPVDSRIPYVTPGPTVVLMAGLQGSGKTTTCGKLAKYMMARGKRPLLVAADLKRPAAIEQLEVIGGQVGCPVYLERDHQNPVKVCRNGVLHARKTDRDVVVLDTAGRLAIDEVLMQEIKDLHATLNPVETLFVVDAMQGQDAVNTAKAFKEALPLTGIVLTKLDGDSRGGAALSVRAITGAPIKFAGVSEKIDGLEVFDAERHAGRILGMGDIVALVEQVAAGVDMEAAQKLAAKVKSGDGFDLNDFLGQLQQMKQMGGLSSLMDKLPAQLTAKAGQVDLDKAEKDIKRKEGIIQSMTPLERRKPELIKATRKKRIAAGAGVQVHEVNRLLKEFEQMQEMMKKMKGGGLMKLMKKMGGMKGLGGGMPKMPF